MPLAAALLLAALRGNPRKQHRPSPSPARQRANVLVNADREFVERKGGGEFVARPVWCKGTGWVVTGGIQ